MTYATFRQRFFASWIDFFILLPLYLLIAWLDSFSIAVAIALTIPLNLMYPAYGVFFHARSGQTPGKRLTGARVVHTDGTPIVLRTAFLRSSVEICFSLLIAVCEIIGLSAIPAAQYYAFDWADRARNVSAYSPFWMWHLTIAFNIWIWNEFFVLLLNKRRRAIHDFIAETVVISTLPEKQPAPNHENLPLTAS